MVSDEAMLHDDHVWDDVMLKEDTRPRSPVLPIIAQFNWQLASCSELLNFRSNSAGLGPGSH